MSIFEEIKTGLLQAIEYEKGNLKTPTKLLSISPVDSFEAGEIREIRVQTGLTQKVFAECLGVSKKTIEAWEAGRNKPDGAARRLLALTKKNPQFLYISGILQKLQNA